MAPTFRLTVAGVEREVTVSDGPEGLSVSIDGQTLQADISRINGSLYSLLLAGRSYEVVALDVAGGYEVLIGNHVFEVEFDRPGARPSDKRREAGVAAAGEVRSPMTGVVVEVTVAPGAEVLEGQVLAVVESMKMNNELRAPRSGTVAAVYVGSGDRVERNTVLVSLA